MIDGRNVVAVIPARAGSKSVKDKNIRPLAGKPLLAWPIDVARRVPGIDRVIVSTDGDAIADVATAHGAEVYRRPAELATDTALVIDTVRDLIARLNAEGWRPGIMLLLEPTSPLRQPGDVEACLRMLVERNLDSVATFTEPSLLPTRAWAIEDGAPRPFIAGADPWLPRQRQPAAWQLNGAVYAFRADRLPAEDNAFLFGATGAVTMSRDRSVDIDEAIDFLVAEALLQKETP